MVGEAAEKKLYDAATKGDVSTFQEMVQQDPHLLDVVSFASSRNILHIAVMWGQESIVEEVLKINPRLARDLDSKMSSSLHIAAAEGSLEIVKNLISVAPEACWWQDCHNMNPIHIAAMNGHDEVLKELLQLDSLPAMERLHRGQTVLHLCVKHRKLSTLKVLVEKLGELVCAKDDDGETLLHLAVRCNQREKTQPFLDRHRQPPLSLPPPSGAENRRLSLNCRRQPSSSSTVGDGRPQLRTSNFRRHSQRQHIVSDAVSHHILHQEDYEILPQTDCFNHPKI